MRSLRTIVGATAVGLASLLSLPSCGGSSGVRTIQAPVDEDPGQIPPTPTPDPFPDAIPYAPSDELALGNNPFPGQITGTGGYIVRNNFDQNGNPRIFYIGPDAYFQIHPFGNPNGPRLNVRAYSLHPQVPARQFTETSLTQGRAVTLLGKVEDPDPNQIGDEFLDLYGMEPGVNPLQDPTYQNRIGDNLVPYTRPNSP